MSPDSYTKSVQIGPHEAPAAGVVQAERRRRNVPNSVGFMMLMEEESGLVPRTIVQSFH
ncbi:unnamed protein product [Ectocarpus sp. 6 AP-2014]